MQPEAPLRVGGRAARPCRQFRRSSTSRRSTPPVTSAPMCTTPSAARPAWRTLLVTSSDTSSRASPSTSSATRPASPSPTAVRAAAGACGQPPRSAPPRSRPRTGAGRCSAAARRARAKTQGPPLEPAQALPASGGLEQSPLEGGTDLGASGSGRWAGQAASRKAPWNAINATTRPLCRAVPRSRASPIRPRARE